MNQNLFNKLMFQSRRGILELDLVLTNFLQHHFQNLSSEECVHFEKMLSLEDEELFRLVFFSESSKKRSEYQDLILKIKNIESITSLPS